MNWRIEWLGPDKMQGRVTARVTIHNSPGPQVVAACPRDGIAQGRRGALGHHPLHEGAFDFWGRGQMGSLHTEPAQQFWPVMPTTPILIVAKTAQPVLWPCAREWAMQCSRTERKLLAS
jgi:hypothetical protein